MFSEKKGRRKNGSREEDAISVRRLKWGALAPSKRKEGS